MTGHYRRVIRAAQEKQQLRQYVLFLLRAAEALDQASMCESVKYMQAKNTSRRRLLNGVIALCHGPAHKINYPESQF